MNPERNTRTFERVIPRESALNIEIEDVLASSICSNCSETIHCLQRMYVKQPILFCDEYRTEALPSTVDTAQLAFTTRKSGIDDSNSLICNGLCLNCANSGNCAWERQGNAIWYCEEYI